MCPSFLKEKMLALEFRKVGILAPYIALLFLVLKCTLMIFRGDFFWAYLQADYNDLETMLEDWY